MKVLFILLSPIYRFFAAKKRAYFSELRQSFRDLYLSAMVDRFNIWHEWIFRPNFEKVRMDTHELEKVKELSKTKTLVYITKNQGQLEYSFFNHRFLKEEIPLSQFANGSRTFFWRPLKDMWRAFIFRIDHYYTKGDLADPIESGYLEGLISKGKSVLLNLKVDRDLVFGRNQEPQNFIAPLIAAADQSVKPVVLITQQFLYDRHPQKVQKSWFDLLFGEKSNPGRIRKFILFLFSYRRRATVKLGQPFDLQEFINKNTRLDKQSLAQKLNIELIDRLEIERKSITGPHLKPTDKLLESLSEHPAFMQDLQSLNLNHQSSQKRKVKDFLKEIAASVNYAYVDLYDHLVRWIVTNVYDGLDIDTKSLSKIKAVAGKHPIILAPSHRSHIDYLLLSYIFYNYDLTLPHICAGINLKFWPADRFIRRAGGFFIRRSFKGDKLYQTVFKHYVKALIREGYSIEFFIEGTRSRTGKMLKPKMGFLSILMQSFIDGDAPDIYFVPTSINYERILEEKSYLKEIEGGSKSKENVRGLFKLRKKFSKKIGRVFVKFAEPISLKSYLQKRGVLADGQDIKESFSCIEDFAYRLTYEINRVSVVTSSSLVAMSLLSYPNKGIPEAKALACVRMLKKYLEYKGASFTSVVSQKSDKAYLEVLDKMVGDKLIAAHHDFKEKFYVLEEHKRSILDYQRNTALHFFVSISCFSKILLSSQASSMSFDELKKRYGIVKVLLSEDFTFSERASLDIHLEKIITFYENQKVLRYQKETKQIYFESALKEESFLLYASLVDCFFEASFLTLQYIKHVSFEDIDRKRLELAIRKSGRVIYLKGDLKSLEALSQFNIRNAIVVYTKLGLIKKDDKAHYTRVYDEHSIAKWEDILMSLLMMASEGLLERTASSIEEASQQSLESEPLHH